MWVASADLPRSAGHPSYERLNRVLDDAGFDAFVAVLVSFGLGLNMGLKVGHTAKTYTQLLYNQYFIRI